MPLKGFWWSIEEGALIFEGVRKPLRDYPRKTKQKTKTIKAIASSGCALLAMTLEGKAIASYSAPRNDA